MDATATPTEPQTATEMHFIEHGERRSIRLDHTPFTIGRAKHNDLVISDMRCSREHAHIVKHGEEFVLVDLGSRRGTYVNGMRFERRKLQADDRIHFGTYGSGASLIFCPTDDSSSSVRDFLTNLSGLTVPAGTVTSDLERLTLFLEAARKLNVIGVLDEILVTLIDTALRLTGAERGYVLLRDVEGKLRVSVGRNRNGELLREDDTVCHSIVEDAVKSASMYVVGDTRKSGEMATRRSVAAFDLRTVICVPLRRFAVGKAQGRTSEGECGEGVRGALYMDSHYATRDLSTVSKEILDAIATQAAAVVENARLVQAEEVARRYQQELTIASSIQQRLMAVTIPKLDFAQVEARCAPCKEIGGDFYDVVRTRSGVGAVVIDVCGKGVTAALLASILQGMIYTDLRSSVNLAELARTTNDFLLEKELGERYATAFIAHLAPSGELDFVNCGHLQPLLIREETVERLAESNVPLGMLPDRTYQCGRRKLLPGDRLVLFTDGVTEAENGRGDCFGDARLEAAAVLPNSVESVFAALEEFCGDVPRADDCTVFEIAYHGPGTR